MRSISVVIPALNEKDGIERTIRAIPKAALMNMGYEVQILVVDNGSTDGTGDTAKAAGADVIVESKRGYGSAFKTGFAHARGDIIATADADCTYPVQDIPQFVNALEQQNLEFLTTDRFTMLKKDAMTFRNRLGNTLLSATMRILFRVNIKDSQSGMWVFRKDILDRLILTSDGWPLSQELKLEACHFSKGRWQEVPIRYKKRLGQTKLGGWRTGLGLFYHLVKKRLARGREEPRRHPGVAEAQGSCYPADQE